VAREVDDGTIWINDWGVVHDEFKEGGFKESGNGRLNGLTPMDEFWHTSTSHFLQGPFEKWKLRGNAPRRFESCAMLRSPYETIAGYVSPVVPALVADCTLLLVVECSLGLAIFGSVAANGFVVAELRSNISYIAYESILEMTISVRRPGPLVVPDGCASHL